MAEEFVRQFAIRMPNGQLYCKPRHNWPAYFGLGLDLPDPAPQPYIWDTRDEATATLQSLRGAATEMGIVEWFGVIVERICTPFTQGDPAEHFAAEVDQWVREQGGES